MEPLIYDDEHSIKLDDFIIHHNVECSQLHDYFDLDTNIEHYFSVLDLEPTNKIKQKKTPKAKPKKTKPKPVIEIAQQLLDEYWNGLINTGLPTSLVSVNNSCIFFYNSPTAEAEMATLILNKITELNTTYNVELTRPTFWSDDNRCSMASFQSWQPDWETVTWVTFSNTKWPPLKKLRAKKVK